MQNSNKDNTKYDKTFLDDIKTSYQQFLFEHTVDQDKSFYDSLSEEIIYPDVAKIIKVIEENKGALKQSTITSLKPLP